MRGIAQLIALMLLLPSVSWAERFHLDDSQTQVLSNNVAMRWDSWAPSKRGQQDSLSVDMQVQLRLNVAQWMGKRVIVYMRCDTRQPMQVKYQGKDWLKSGSMRSGEERVIYQGTIASDFLEDMLHITLASKVNDVEQNDQLKSTFTLEVVE